MALLSVFLNNFQANTFQFSTLDFFFNSILFKLDYISVFSIEKILSFLKSNVNLIKKYFDQITVSKILNCLIMLWNSGMHVVNVPNSITKSIANNLIILLRKFDCSINKVFFNFCFYKLFVILFSFKAKKKISH